LIPTESDLKLNLKLTFIRGLLFVMAFCFLNRVETQSQKTASQTSKVKVQKFLFYKTGFDPANRSGDAEISEFDQKIFELFRTEMAPREGDIAERDISLRSPFERLSDQILAQILGPIDKVNPQQVELMLGFGSHGGRGYICHGPGGTEQELYGNLWTELLKIDQVLSELGLQKVTLFVTIVSCYSGSSIWGLERLFKSELGLKFKSRVFLFNSSQDHLETYSQTTLSHLESAKKWMTLVGSNSPRYSRWKSKFSSPWERLIYFLGTPWRESLDHNHEPQVYHIQGAQLLKAESLKEVPFANDLGLEHRFSFLNDPKYDYYAHFSMMRTLLLTLPDTQPFRVLFDVKRAGGPAVMAGAQTST
jgi:hypothetical protein